MSHNRFLFVAEMILYPQLPASMRPPEGGKIGGDPRVTFIDLFVEQETRCAELYTLFAGRYPELREFWEGLAEEEKGHAAAVLELSRKISSREVLFVEGRTRAHTLQVFLEYVKGVIRRARSESFPLSTALSLALDIERSFFERKLFEHFRGDSPPVRKTLQMLQGETSEHILRLERMWKEKRGAQ